MIQLSVIIVATYLGGRLFRHLHMPAVLGEMLAGVVIGPFALGGLAFLGLNHGLFPVIDVFPISVELYGIATLASIVLLFYVGLETDLDTFMRFSVAGTSIGLAGGLLSFILGNFAGMIYLQMISGELGAFDDPVCLFFGVISTATSVSITARLLLEKRRMNSPDGVTILAAAVIDDIIGIVALAIVVGLSMDTHLNGDKIAIIAFKAIGTWLVVMVIGLLLAKRLSHLLHKLGSPTTIAIISLSLALLLAGVFEMAGLAMVIGAYTAGLILSRTDLAFLIQDQLDPIQKFLVPIFFCVMGMFIDPRILLNQDVVIISLIYTILAIVGKFIGCFVPAIFLNFNTTGAARIAIGMIPRGEIALIIAGVGISTGLITQEIFSIAVVMTFFTTLLTPPILSRLLNSDNEVLKKPLVDHHELLTIRFDMPTPETAEFIHTKLLQSLRNDGFFAHRQYHGIYSLCKGDRFMTMRYSRLVAEFQCHAEEETFIYILYHDVMNELDRFINKLRQVDHTDQIKRKIISPHGQGPSRSSPGVFGRMSPFAIEHNLKGNTPEEILKSLMQLPLRSGELSKKQSTAILKELIQHEKISSMVLTSGIAFPHVHTENVERLVYAFGICRQGVEFGDLDKKLTHLFVLALIPLGKHDEHLEDFAELSKYLSHPENRKRLLEADSHVSLVRCAKGL
jgi:Kef-type K+ transport system membrane component KefB/mannitol/fructose-specific phosphotransferase system IIA component (Ntr-type)